MMTRHTARLSAHTLFCTYLITLAVLWFIPCVAEALTPEQLDQTLRTTVMIRAVINGDAVIGAGFIVGRDRDSIYIATAGHVVGRGDVAADRVEVAFRDQPDAWVSAAIAERSTSQLDLAVVRVRTAIDPCAVHLERAADAKTVARGAEVYPVGYPNGVAWGVPVTPGRVARIDAGDIVFESAFLAGGHSGGPLLTGTGEIAGLLKSDAGPLGQAVPIWVVLNWIRERGHPLMLRVATPGVAGPLHVAAERGDSVAVERELFGCANVDARDGDGETPLHEAAAKGYTAIAQRLVDRGAGVNAVSDKKRRVAGRDGGSASFVEQEQKIPLHLAIAARAADTAVLLIERGANPSLKAIELKVGPSGDYLPITWTPPTTLAIEQRLTAVLNALIAKRADLDAPVDTRWRDETEVEHDNARTPLRTAIALGYPEAVDALLRGGARAEPQLLEAAINDGSRCTVPPESAVAVLQLLVRSSVTFSEYRLNSALELAIRLANGSVRERACPKPRLLDLVIERGAAVNVATDEPPLTMAARYDAVSAAASLVARGANVNAKNRFGETALHTAARYGAAGVAALLVKNGADVNVRDSESARTPLSQLVLAAERDRAEAFVETARVLVAGKANLNLRDANGDTPLNRAVDEDVLQLAHVLLDAGADPNIASNDGWTPLHNAAQGGKLAIAQALLEHGAMLDPKNREGETPLWRAVMVVSGNGGPAKEKDVNVVLRLLVGRGANVNILTHRDYSMLDHAVANGDVETARLLLERGAKGSAFTMEKLAGQRR